MTYLILLMTFFVGMSFFVNAMENNKQLQLFSVPTPDGQINFDQKKSFDQKEIDLLKKYSKTFNDYYTAEVAATKIFPISIRELCSNILSHMYRYDTSPKKIAKKDIIYEVHNKDFDTIVDHIYATHVLEMPAIKKMYLKAFAERISSDKGMEQLQQELSKKRLRNLPESLKKELADYAPHIRIQAILKDPQCLDAMITKRKIPFNPSLASFCTRVWLGHNKQTVMTSHPDDGQVGDIMQLSDDTTGRILQAIQMHDRAGTVKFDARGERFLYASKGPSIHLKDIRNDTVQSLDTGATLNGCAICHDGTKVASVHEDHIILWDITTLSDIKKMREISVSDALLKVKFPAQDDFIVMLTDKGITKLDYTDRECDDYILSCEPKTNCLKLSPQYWVYDDHGFNMVYDVAKKSSCLLDKEHYSNFVFSPSGNYFAALSNEKIKVWNVKIWMMEHPDPQVYVFSSYDKHDVGIKMVIVLDRYLITEYADQYFRDYTTIFIWDFKENKASRIYLLHRTALGNHFTVSGNYILHEQCTENEILLYPDFKSIAQPVPLDEIEIPIPKKQQGYLKEFFWPD